MTSLCMTPVRDCPVTHLNKENEIWPKQTKNDIVSNLHKVYFQTPSMNMESPEDRQFSRFIIPPLPCTMKQSGCCISDLLIHEKYYMISYDITFCHLEKIIRHFNGPAQDCSISVASAMEILQYNTRQSILCVWPVIICFSIHDIA